jgi:hypothetical protein
MVADGGYTATDEREGKRPAEAEVSEGAGAAAELPDGELADAELTPEAVADSTGDRYWSVDECPWTAVCPNLSDDLADLLAPPVLVGATPLGDEPFGDEGAHRMSAARR